MTSSRRSTSAGGWPNRATPAEPFHSKRARLILRPVPTSERVGKNEALFREVNERIMEVSERVVAVDGEATLEFVCECSEEGCSEPVQLTLSEYESIRSEPTHFLVAPGHVWQPETEWPVRENETYAVVEKTGDAGDVASDKDPR